MSAICTGIKKSVTAEVTEEMLAVNVGSGGLRVLSTPSVAALMERAAFELLEQYLPDGMTSVGTLISVRHFSASPFRSTITAEAVLTAVDDRKYSFEITASDNCGEIAKAEHERFAVKAERFMEKTNAKL